LRKSVERYRATWLLAIGLLSILSSPTSADLALGPEELVQANSTIISVPGYSVPSFVDWNGDGLKDLVVGEGPATLSQGKVRIYLNVGSEAEPQFGVYFYAQSEGVDLVVPGAG